MLCKRGVRVGSQQAFDAARAAVSRTSIPTGLFSLGSLDPDGNAEYWHFTFQDPKADEEISVDVSPHADPYVRHSPGARCGEEARIRTLDSRAIFHDAVPRFERALGRSVRIGLDALSFVQDGCPAGWPEYHFVELLDPAQDASDAGALGIAFYARYRDDASFIELDGPCQDYGVPSSCIRGN
jgi:hypothetical protein